MLHSCPFPLETVIRTIRLCPADNCWFTSFGEGEELANSALSLELVRRLTDLLGEKGDGKIPSNTKINRDNFAHVTVLSVLSNLLTHPRCDCTSLFRKVSFRSTKVYRSFYYQRPQARRARDVCCSLNNPVALLKSNPRNRKHGESAELREQAHALPFGRYARLL